MYLFITFSPPLSPGDMKNSWGKKGKRYKKEERGRDLYKLLDFWDRKGYKQVLFLIKSLPSIHPVKLRVVGERKYRLRVKGRGRWFCCNIYLPIQNIYSKYCNITKSIVIRLIERYINDTWTFNECVSVVC